MISPLPLPTYRRSPVGQTINHKGLILHKRKKGNHLVEEEKNNNGNKWQ